MRYVLDTTAFSAVMRKESALLTLVKGYRPNFQVRHCIRIFSLLFSLMPDKFHIIYAIALPIEQMEGYDG